MRKMMAVVLMGLALTAFEVSSDAQSRERSDRKPAATANKRKPSPAAKPSSGSSTRPVRPDVKPGGTTNKPSGPATKPSGPATKPAPKPKYHPTPTPGHGPSYGPGYKPGYHPAPRPKPVIVKRPSYGSILAANIASGLILSAVRAATAPVYVPVSPSLNLTHSYVGAGTAYYYQDGVFYIVDQIGQYITIVPPTGALVEYLPEDYRTFRRNGNKYYQVDDTVYALTIYDGTPYFEVLGQIR